MVHNIVTKISKAVSTSESTAFNWDLSNVLAYAKYQNPTISEKVLEEALLEYRYFMVIASTYSKYAEVPTTIVDYIWHAHILHTEDYHNFCQAIAGKFIHHRPIPFNQEGFLSNKHNLEELSQETFGKMVFNFDRQKTLPNVAYMCSASTPETE